MKTHGPKNASWGRVFPAHAILLRGDITRQDTPAPMTFIDSWKIKHAPSIVAGVALLVTLGALAWAYIYTQRFVEQAQEVTSVVLALQAPRYLDTQLDLALLLSTEAYRMAPTEEARTTLQRVQNTNSGSNTNPYSHTSEVTCAPC